MRAIRILWAPLLCLLLLVPAIMVAGPPAAGHAAATTNVLSLDLGTLGGTSSWAYDLHPSGLVVGSSQLAGDASRAYSYDLLAGGPMRDLGTLDELTHYSLVGITDAGMAIGEAYGIGVTKAFVVDATATSPTMTALPFPADASTNPWMQVNVVDDAGRVAGWWGDDDVDGSNYRGYAYDPGTTTTTNLGVFGDDFTFRDMNAATAVGYRYRATEDDYTAFVQALDGTPRIELNTEFGWDDSSASAISDDGLVVGEYCDDSVDPDDFCTNDEWTGFAWDQANSPVELPGRDGLAAQPMAINDDWIIVRELWPSYAALAYTRADLSLPPIPLDGLRYPVSISDAGIVVGQTSDGTAPAVYDLGATAPELVPLPTLGGEASAKVAEHVGGHVVVVGAVHTGGGTYHAVAWVVGVPDAPTVALVADGDGIAPAGSLTADETPTLAGSTDPSGPVVVRAGDGTVLATVTADEAGAWSYTSPLLTDGTYEFTATLEPVGDWPSNPAAATVTVETVPPPTVTVGTPKVTGSTVTVPFTITGTYEPASLTCQLDDTTPVPCASTTEHTFTEVVQGDHVATIAAATPAGAVGRGSSIFTVKAAKYTSPEPPSTVLAVAISDVAAAKNGPITATFEAQAGTAPHTFTCTLVGATIDITQACTSPWTYPSDGSWLAGGRYELTVTVTDSAIPAGTATATTTVNVPGPKP